MTDCVPLLLSCKTVDYHVCLNYMFTLPIITLQLVSHSKRQLLVLYWVDDALLLVAG